jgi:hypothetical protein
MRKRNHRVLPLLFAGLILLTTFAVANIESHSVVQATLAMSTMQLG